MQFVPTHTTGKIHCCGCGTLIDPNPMNMCIGCIRAQVDITEGIERKQVIDWCRTCGSYLNPPKAWIFAERESQQLLGLCLARVRPSLRNVRLINADFIWTEPHSRRLLLKILIQKEIMTGVVLEQELEIEFTENPHICPNCTLAATENTWKAQVQVRQRVDHKRTFFFLEQVILKSQEHLQTVSMKEYPDGVDFFFGSTNHADRFVKFIRQCVPCINRGQSERVMSSDLANNTIDKRFTYLVEIVPLCKNDLFVMPKGTPGGHGMCLVTRVTSVLHCLDLATLQHFMIDPKEYFTNSLGFRPIRSSNQAHKFEVSYMAGTDGPPVAVDPNVPFTRGEMVLYEAGSAACAELVGYTHMAHLYRNVEEVETFVWGYDLSTAVINECDLNGWKSEELLGRMGMNYERAPVIIVRKDRGKPRQRKFRLNRMAVEQQDDTVADNYNYNADYEEFMNELEEDPEMRGQVNLFRDPHYRGGEQGQVDDAELLAGELEKM